MLRGLVLFAAATMVGFAAPASAATVLAEAMPAALPVTKVLTGTSTTSGTSLLYSSGTGANLVNFSATALTYTTSLTPSVSTAIKYDVGLSVNPSGDNRHTIDNAGAYDFIMLRFDRSVILNGATFANANWYNDQYADTDATISRYAAHWANLGQTYATNLANNTTAKTKFFNAAGAALDANKFESLSTASGTQTRSFNTGVNAKASNVWIIGASITNADRRVDSFKLTSVSYILPPPPGGVPEPSTWAMLILGMGAVGGAMRRRRSREFLALA